jgi:hypothetical protein
MKPSPESAVWEIEFKKPGYEDQNDHALTLFIHSPNILTAMETAEKVAQTNFHQLGQVHIMSVKHILFTHN